MYVCSFLQTCNLGKLLSPPLVLARVYEPYNALELPCQLKLKHYCSFMAKLQFAATWIHFDNMILFVASQLACFCASLDTASRQCFNILWNSWLAIPAPRLCITEAGDLLSCPAMLMLTGSKVPQSRGLAWPCCLTRRRSCGIEDAGNYCALHSGARVLLLRINGWL